MSRTIVTNSGSRFLTSISSERLIGLLSKEVGGQYSEDFDGPVMAYDMSSDGVKDLDLIRWLRNTIIVFGSYLIAVLSRWLIGIIIQSICCG